MERARLSKRMLTLLSELDPEGQAEEMREVERLLSESGYLTAGLDRSSALAFIGSLTDQPEFRALAGRRPVFDVRSEAAESPSDLILRMLPSDGHLE
ncbi:hypothetical protein [Rhodoplanes sp. SY1]|uniref:hypothetical protein n=1 Tax=Rhodoplanes sp. SY1 TaxID=3166646 RepID=UPI0038B5BDB4